MTTGKKSQTEDANFATQQLAATWYPKAAEAMGGFIARLQPGNLPTKPDNGTHEANIWQAVERSLELCDGCLSLDDCSQLDYLGSGTRGYHLVITNLFYVTASLRRCHFGRLSDEAKNKLWMEKRHAEKTFAGFVTTEKNRAAFNACRQYLRKLDRNIDEGSGLVLSGPTGVGKTHLATAVFREVLMQKACSGSFVYMPDYIAVIKDRYGTSFDKLGGGPSESAEAYIEATMNAKFVVLDNFEFRQVTDWLIDTLNRILDRRYRSMLSTVVTTGWGPERMAENLEPKLASRLVEMGEWYRIMERDFRREKTRRNNGSPKKGSSRRKK